MYAGNYRRLNRLKRNERVQGRVHLYVARYQPTFNAKPTPLPTLIPRYCCKRHAYYHELKLQAFISSALAKSCLYAFSVEQRTQIVKTATTPREGEERTPIKPKQTKTKPTAASTQVQAPGRRPRTQVIASASPFLAPPPHPTQTHHAYPIVVKAARDRARRYGRSS